MQATVISCNENNKSDKLFINDSNFSKNFFDNGNVKIINVNDTKISYIFFTFSNNSSPDFSILN